jgi:single-stranded DNA-binding protein
MAIKKQNESVVQGEVVAMDNSGFTVLTKQTVFSGTYDNKVTFSSDRVVEIGERLRIKAQMVFDGEKTKLVPIEFGTPSDGYVNIGRLVGTTAGALRYLPATESQAALANALVDTGGGLFRVVLFEPQASLWYRLCKRNSEVFCQGRVQHRAYTDRNGDEQSMLELVADPDYTRIVSVPKANAEFAMGFSTPAPGPAPSEAPKSNTPGKPKGAVSPKGDDIPF